ncbi:hypothetical protein BSKO_08374 [Bryopsis sp. KO-2023]|nr:hypothetical protein BSKO_08374 [Bryopsis sp. KO-2023]
MLNAYAGIASNAAAAAKPAAQTSEERVQALWERVKARDPDQPEFLQAVEEVLTTMKPVFEKRPEYIPVMERLCEPERQIMFRVPWVDDAGNIQVNRGYRVQFNSAIGPYKGGLRFHPTVTLSVVKFLGFEQIFKNSLTTLPMGGGKGGSDFDPKGKSDNEVMRFCQSFMTELSRHIGSNTDVPAGDIGVGGREIGYLFGQYKRLQNEFSGILTGKGFNWGGSNIRPEATGYGVVYFAKNALDYAGDSFKGKRVAVSGSGNVAQFTVEKLLEFGAIPVSLSDSSGTIIEEDGFTIEKLAMIMDIKNKQRERISVYAEKSSSAKFLKGERPWKHVSCDIAMPSATQNELDEEDAKALVAGGCKMVVEGANMPSTPEAIKHLNDNGVEFGPAKAANAGGVATSGLEMSQNSLRLQWSREEVDTKLQKIMKDIFDASRAAADEYGTNLQAGSNIAGFLKVADSMLSQGCV